MKPFERLAPRFLRLGERAAIPQVLYLELLKPKLDGRSVVLLRQELVLICYFLGHMCNRPLGMMTGAIKNSAITASSMWDKYHAPFLARLKARRMGKYMSAWSAR